MKRITVAIAETILVFAAVALMGLMLLALESVSAACPMPHPGLDLCNGADVNCDYTVDVLDVIDMLMNWGGEHEACDINDDNSIDVLDLVIVLDNWGCCLCAEVKDE